MPCISALPVIITSLLGTITLPVPLARSSRSLFEAVVVIKLSLILIFSNCAVPDTVTLPVISMLPVCTKLPVCVVLPTCVIVPVIFVSCKSVVPLTVRFCAISTSVLGTFTFPVPFAFSTRSSFVIVFSITLLSIKIVPLVKLSAVTVPVLVMSTVVVVPLTVKSFSNTTSFKGT